MLDKIIAIVNNLRKEDIDNIVLRDRTGETLDNLQDTHET